MRSNSLPMADERTDAQSAMMITAGGGSRFSAVAFSGAGDGARVFTATRELP